MDRTGQDRIGSAAQCQALWPLSLTNSSSADPADFPGFAEPVCSLCVPMCPFVSLCVPLSPSVSLCVPLCPCLCSSFHSLAPL